MTWQPIETAPREGGKVWVKREYHGEIVAEGWAVFNSMADDAPMRSPMCCGIDGIIPPDNGYADVQRWLKPDRRHAFPLPTHWNNQPPEESE